MQCIIQLRTSVCRSPGCYRPDRCVCPVKL